jgi:H+-transporting ATPase
MPLASPATAPANVAVPTNNSQNGISSDEARSRLEKTGPNSMPDTAVNPLRRALTKFWTPIPWMLEAAILLELVLGKFVEAGIIAVLLVFNAALGFFQEGRAQPSWCARPTAEGGFACGAQSRGVQRHSHCPSGCICHGIMRCRRVSSSLWF